MDIEAGNDDTMSDIDVIEAPSPAQSPRLKREASEDDTPPEDIQNPKRPRLDLLSRSPPAYAEQPDAGFNPDRTLSPAAEGNAGRDRETQPPRSESPGERGPKRHPKYFYEDGSVVVQVEQTLFRLHKTLLSVQSTFFRELFADAQHHATEFAIDNGASLPLYVLSVDGLHVADFERLLEIMENPLLISRAAESPSLDFVSSVVLATHLLKFDIIHAWAAEELHGYWPSNLDRIGDEPDDWLLCVEYASAALQLSRDAGVPEIYKGAFYELLRRESFGQDAAPMINNADYNLLTRARQLCTTVWMGIISKPFPRSRVCKDNEKASGEKSTCVARRNDLLYYKWGTIVDNTKARDLWMDPIAGFETLRGIELPHEERNGLCASCLNSWKVTWKEKKVEFWGQLDGILDGTHVEA
ncbi:unnamed protein product [Peniophora sp. CBMAI 1063]|nr:unnamed protein product [Peniophora sp. CBMAI 1063]